MGDKIKNYMNGSDAALELAVESSNGITDKPTKAAVKQLIAAVN